MKPSGQALYFPSATPQTEGRTAIRAGDVGVIDRYLGALLTASPSLAGSYESPWLTFV